MSKNLDKQIAFITGGNRGLGFETAKQLGQLGILPVIGARSEAAGRDAVAQLKAAGVDAESIVFDATRPADRQAAVEFFEQRAGRLDILVNNAGVYLEGDVGAARTHTPSTLPEKVLRDTLETNFFAPVALTQALLPLLRKSPAGRIVNLSSILGSLTLHADPTSPIYDMKSLAYDASKTALNAWTVQLAYELKGETTKVNSAHPGWVQTAMGGSAAPMSVVDGAKTSVQLATLPASGPSGGFSTWVTRCLVSGRRAGFEVGQGIGLAFSIRSGIAIKLIAVKPRRYWASGLFDHQNSIGDHPYREVS